jgi:error-prone DNA polymerase
LSGSYVELHVRSAFSLLRAGSSVEALVARAAEVGLPALALTDYMTLAGVVRFQAACAKAGIHPIVGAELAIADPVFGDAAVPANLVVLAENAAGYARLCQLLTEANLRTPDQPVIPFTTLAAVVSDGLVVLTGGSQGTLVRLLAARQREQASAVVKRYRDVFGPERVFIELQHHQLPESRLLLQDLSRLAKEVDLRCVATNGVCYATREDYPIYDLLTCVRLGIHIDTPHRERPRNDEAYLKPPAELLALFDSLPRGDAALAATNEIAGRCRLTLLKGVCTAPEVSLPAGETPTSQLRRLCEVGLRERYANRPAAQAKDSLERRQLNHELEVIDHLELEEFFLCVQQIVCAARSMGIRISGRGSAANSLVAYLLGITGVDPIQHHLLFERFLNPERRGMPDIDLDVQSDRRDELIRYVERTYNAQHAAMVANVITYRPRLALRDTAKALGFPLPLVSRLTKVLPHYCDPERLPSYAEELTHVITHATTDPAQPGRERDSLSEAVRDRCLDRLPLALQLAARLYGLPRHLSLHNGGLVLTREPLSQLLPVRISANGVRALEVDKDDVERLGLIKFDLLGLRTLGAVEEALALIEETAGVRPDIDHLPTMPPDPATMRLIRAGQTLAVFQIESPGQWHLLAQTQPDTFDDLIVQTALFRPGPIQANMVHPYVERRQHYQAHQKSHQTGQAQSRPPQTRGQREAVQTPWHGPPDDFWIAHSVIGPILRDSEGILLFQEQILMIAHAFAGLSYAEADNFRRAMSHARSPREMAAMRERFLAGALALGESSADAERVFEAISHFVGYGFCKSHAAEFSRTIYQTAWLKAHYPAQYLAAFLSSQPAGYFPPHVVLEEAKRLGIPVLPVDINASEDRFSVERVGSRDCSRWAIRIGLRQIQGVGEEPARAILFERQRPFTSLQDLCARMRPRGLNWTAASALVWSGACDSLRPRLERRQRLWQLHELWPLIDPTATGAHAATGRKRRRAGYSPKAIGTPRERRSEETRDGIQQLPLAWENAFALQSPLPKLPSLSHMERLALDYQLLGMSALAHPMRLRRRQLRHRGIYAIAELASVPEGQITRVAGWVISAQRPPTANGMGFLVLEDETGRLSVAVPPRLALQLHRLVRETQEVIVRGQVERIRWYRSVLALDLLPLKME